MLVEGEDMLAMVGVSADARVKLADKREAMNTFLASVEGRAFRVAMAQLKDRDAALDAVQDAMIRLVQKYSAKPEEEWAPLFFRILMNRIRDDQRAAQRFVDLEGAEDRRAAADNPEDQLAQRQALSALESAMEGLPARQREAVMLRVWQGFNVAETANIMGCGEGSVKTHLSRAMTVLRTTVEGFWA